VPSACRDVKLFAQDHVGVLGDDHQQRHCAFSAALPPLPARNGGMNDELRD
jgi:hypothetical protein